MKNNRRIEIRNEIRRIIKVSNNFTRDDKNYLRKIFSTTGEFIDELYVEVKNENR